MDTPFIATFSVENSHKSDIFALASCPKYTLAASGDGTISLWDNASPSDTLTALNQQPIRGGVHHLAVDAAGNYVAAVSFDGKIAVYNLKTQQSLKLSSAEGLRGIWACAIAGSLLAVSSLQGTVYILDIAEDNLVSELREPSSGGDTGKQPCLCVDLSSDGGFVAAGYESGKTRVYSVATGRLAYTLPTHLAAPRCVKFNPQGTLVAVTGDETVALFTLHGGSYIGSLQGHESFVYSIAFDESGERLLSVAGDGKARVWSLDSRAALFTLSDSTSALFACAWVPGRTNIIGGAPAGFATAGVDKAIRWYREASGSSADF